MKLAYLSSGARNIKVAPKFFGSVCTLVYESMFVKDRSTHGNGVEVWYVL
jgi:hypothetical protein